MTDQKLTDVAARLLAATEGAENPETPEEMELRIEARWMNEFRAYTEANAEHLLKHKNETFAWRSFMIRSLKGSVITLEQAEALTVAGVSSDDPETEEILATIIDKLTTYLQMGIDFETMMTAVKTDESLENSWDMFLVSLRLGGHDQVPGPD